MTSPPSPPNRRTQQIVVTILVCLANSVSAAEPPPEKPASPKPSYEQRRRAWEAILDRMVRDHGYGLVNGQAVKRIPQPVPAIAADFYHAERGEPSGNEPDASFFRYRDGKLVNWGSTFRGGKQKGYTLSQLLDAFFGLKGRMVEGSPSLLEKDLPGHWVILDSALQLPGEAPAQLEKILAADLDFHVKLEMREVERPVIVVRGVYKYSPTRLDAEKEKADPSTTDVLRIYEDDVALDARPNSFASGDFGHFLTWLGEAVNAIVIDERSVQTEGGNIPWRGHPTGKVTAPPGRTKADAHAILKNIESQTSLTFTPELRPVNVMFVTPVKLQ